MPDLLETLVSYVPALILRQMAHDPTPITIPSSEQFLAAALFADISGFTALTERLAQHGLSGLEELTRILNAYFGQMVAIITSHGGDVVKFAGDSLLALWPVFTDDLATATHRAAQCALAIQQRLKADVGSDGVRLSLKLCIGAGQMATVHVGGVFGRWEFLVTGEPLVQMGRIAAAVQAGDVVLSPEAWTLIAQHAEGRRLAAARAGADKARTEQNRELGDTRPRQPIHPATAQMSASFCLRSLSERLPLPVIVPLGLPPEAETGLRAYLPNAILSRLVAGQTGWLAELRRLTIIFINLPDLSYDTPLARSQTVIRALQTALYRYEGSVNKITVDDKGVMFVAALGLPPLSHEDDPARGVLAALAMQSVLHDLGVRSAIGVTTGRAFCGVVGSTARREYTVMGAVVNLAARLMQDAARYFNAPPRDDRDEAAAPYSQNGQSALLCDEATYLAARAVLDFEALPPVRVKGKPAPVPVYRPLGPKRMRVQPHEALVGRAAERTALAEELQLLLRGGEGRVVIVEGDAGIGKSRLIADLLDRARASGIQPLVGSGSAVEQGTPYFVWRAILGALLSIDWTSDIDDQRAHVLSRLAVAPELLRLAPLLNAVLPLDIPENELTAQMSGQVRADNTRDLLLRLVQATARLVPTVLVLRDFQWFDSASLALIVLAGQTIHPLLIVITTRPVESAVAADCLAQLRDLGARQMRLEGLAHQETKALICQRLSVESVPDLVVNLVREKAQGNPLFIEELTGALRDAGLIVVEDGICLLARDAALHALDLPDTVQSVITSRIDRLNPAQQLALKVASVIGRTFTFRLLHDIYPVEPDRLHLADCLDALQEMGLLLRAAFEPDLTYTFKQTVTQDVAYNLMLFAQRRKLHRAVAEWYERSHSDDLSPFYGLLAHHWNKADEQTNTLAYVARAAEHALRSGAYREAIDFLNQALTLEAGQRATDREQPAPVEPAPAAERSSSSALQRACWERQLGDAYQGMGQIVESQKHLRQALALLGYPEPTTKRALLLNWGKELLRHQWLHRLGQCKQATPEEAPWLIEAVRADQRLGRIYYLANRTLPTFHSMVRSMNLAERLGPSPELARSYINLALGYGSIPLNWLLTPIADTYVRLAHDTARHVGHLPTIGYVLMTSGMYYVGACRWDAAQANLDRARTLLEDLGDLGRDWGDCLTAAGFAMYFRGRFADGVKYFAELYTSGMTGDNTEHKAWGLNGLAMNAMGRGQTEDALTMLETALPLFGVIEESRISEVINAGVRATAHLRQGHLPAAQRAADHAASLLRHDFFPISVATFDGFAGMVEVYLELLAASAGQPASVRGQHARTVQQACFAFQRFAWMFPVAQPRALLCLGRYAWLMGRAAAARTTWQRALKLAARLGMPYEEGLIHSALGRHSTGLARRRHLELACRRFTQVGAEYDLEQTLRSQESGVRSQKAEGDG